MGALVDYNDDPGHDPENMSHGQLVTYWKTLYYEKYHANYIWQIKDTTLLSKLLKVYSGNQVRQIIDYFWKHGAGIITFGTVYVTSTEIWQKIQAKEEGWSWN